MILTLTVAGCSPFLHARADEAPASCSQDVMIVFDASGSMGGTDMNSVTPRIGKVREALAKVLPDVAPVRPMGLIVYGPGAANNCNSIELRLKPALNADAAIMHDVNSTVPAGRTPLTASVSQAADVLDYKSKPATIVLITDGEETCGGDPCGVASALKRNAKDLTIHVIGYKDPLAIKGPFGSRCMADATGGKYIAVDTTDQLIAALRATLGCPFVTQAPASAKVRSAMLSPPRCQMPRAAAAQ
ncbi:MAG: VWA domain-containing protein [Hyphomicrobium sp.]|nr:VWA domain-containing protein [Hyphomicrobium sp.]